MERWELRRLRSWREAREGLLCHASELEEFLSVVKWNEFGTEAKAVASIFGVEPARVEASLKVGKVVSVFPLPPPRSKSEVVERAFSVEYNKGLVVKKGGSYFVEPAMLWKDGFAVIPDPLKAVKEISDELGIPVVIYKDVPAYCCWTPLPIAGCANVLRDAGEFRKGVPLAHSEPKVPLPPEGCWDVKLEEGPCWEGFKSYPRTSFADMIKIYLVPLRKMLIKILPSPKIGDKRW